jgi:hypothetical protein
VKVLASGDRAVDYRRFHDVVAIEPPGERATAQPRRADRRATRGGRGRGVGR